MSAVFGLVPAVVGSATIARPGDTSAYAALDVVADSTTTPDILKFANLGRRKGGYGVIVKAMLVTDQKTCTARFRLHLFTTSPTAINDNAPYLLLYSGAASRVGSIDFAPASTEDGTNSTAAWSLNNYTRLPFICDGADTALYGILETLDAFTPANAQNVFIKLEVEQG